MPRKSPRRIVVITGASNGPGRAIALEFALHGDGLVLGSRREEPLEIVRRDCDALGAWTLAQVADLTEGGAVALADAARARFKRIDVWINYAPAVPLQRGDVTPGDALAPGLAFDLSGYVNGATAALAVFEKQGHGVLVNVDSLIGGAPAGCEDAYQAARREVKQTFAAIERQARAVPGVHVTSVRPARTPVSSAVLAPMIVSLARAQSRREPNARLAGELERLRFHVQSRLLMPQRRTRRATRAGRDSDGAVAEERASARHAPHRPARRARAATVREGSTGGAAVLETGVPESSQQHGGWHLASVAPNRENATTVALVLGVPAMVMAAALLLVR